MTLPVGFAGPNQLNGATEPISAVDIRLDALSTPVQSVNMTTTGLNFYLPNATEKKTGGPVFIISAVATSQTFVIRDFAGNAITTVAAGAAVILSLTNNISSAGSWSCKAFSSITQLIAGTATVGNATASNYIAIATISPTQAMIVYNDSGAGGALKAVVVTVSGGAVTFGVIFSVNAYTSIYVSAAPLVAPLSGATATQIICTYRRSSTTFLEAVVLVPSGTGSSATVTAGAIKVVNGIDSTYTNVSSFSTTQAVCAYCDTTPRSAAVVLNISGTTITNGTIAAVDTTGTCTWTTLVSLTGTKALCTYNSSAGSAPRAKILDVAASVITAGTLAFGGGGTNASYSSLAALSATKVIWAYQGTSTYLQTIILDVSVSTITAATELAINAAASTYSAIVAVNSTTAICSYIDFATTSFVRAVTLSISGSIITAGTITNVNSVASNYNSICALSASKFVDAYSGASNFLNAQVVEYTVSV